jgi:hypothetical protein
VFAGAPTAMATHARHSWEAAWMVVMVAARGRPIMAVVAPTYSGRSIGPGELCRSGVGGWAGCRSYWIGLCWVRG